MATACIPQVSFEFQGLRQPVVARFDQPHASSHRGAVLLKALDDQLGVTERLARSLRDPRQPGKIDHALIELVRQRVYGIACGYADCNDAARLAQDPVHKLLLERDPLAGPDLASQATLSRFENAVGRQALYLASVGLADLVIEHHRARLGGRARRITIDLDPTDDPTHGQQEFSFFNGHYHTWCYLPVVATLTFNAEPRQYVVAAVLRPAPARPSTARSRSCGACSPACGWPSLGDPSDPPRWRLRQPRDLRLPGDRGGRIPRGHGQQCAPRQAQPPADGARADALEGQWPDRAPLRRDALRGPQVEAQTAGHHQSRGRAASRAHSQEQPPLRGHQSRRRARSRLPALLWARRHGESAQGAASRAGMDRTSCHRFFANHFRVLLTVAAYILFQTLQAQAAGHRLCRCAGQHAARAADQARRVGRALGAAHRAASPHHVPLADDLATDRAPRRRAPA